MSPREAALNLAFQALGFWTFVHATHRSSAPRHTQHCRSAIVRRHMCLHSRMNQLAPIEWRRYAFGTHAVSILLSASHAARCVACHGVRSHAVPVALVGECSMAVV
jgi:hypothetical protein